jgi:hypothetical protein
VIFGTPTGLCAAPGTCPPVRFRARRDLRARTATRGEDTFQQRSSRRARATKWTRPREMQVQNRETRKRNSTRRVRPQRKFDRLGEQNRGCGRVGLSSEQRTGTRSASERLVKPPRAAS